MAMMEGPSTIDLAAYHRHRPHRLLEQQLDVASFYTAYVRIQRNKHTTSAEEALALPAKVDVSPNKVGKLAVKLLFLDQDFHEVSSADGSMQGGIWTPTESLILIIPPTQGLMREGFLKNYDDGLGTSILAHSAAKELAAV